MARKKRKVPMASQMTMIGKLEELVVEMLARERDSKEK